MPFSNDNPPLPNELVLQILLLLDHNDFRHVMHASRRFRGLCTDQPEHFFTCKLIADLSKSKQLENKVTRFVTMLREMTASGQPIALKALVVFSRQGGKEPDLDCWRVALQAISEAFVAGAKIVGIMFQLTRVLWTNELLTMMMAHPTPRLRRLKLLAFHCTSGHSFDLPAGIMHGGAPCLQEVLLQNIHIGQEVDEVEAFRDVSIVRLIAPKARDLRRIGRMFPKAREIYLLQLDFSDLIGLSAGQSGAVACEASVGRPRAIVLWLSAEYVVEPPRNIGVLVMLVAPDARTVEIDFDLISPDLRPFVGFFDDLVASVFGSPMLFVSINRDYRGTEYVINEPNSNSRPTLRVRFNHDAGYGYDEEADEPFPGTFEILEGLQRQICNIKIGYTDIHEFISVWGSIEQLNRVEVDITFAPGLAYDTTSTTPDGGCDDSHQHRATDYFMQRELVLLYYGKDSLQLPAANAVSIASRLRFLEDECAVSLNLQNVFLDPATASDLPSFIILRT